MNVDPSGRVSSDNICEDLGQLTLGEFTRCNYAYRMLDRYPDSQDLNFWLRFSPNGLMDLAQNTTEFIPSDSRDDFAIVPLDFATTTVKEREALDVLRFQEELADRPLKFSEILAMVINAEVSIVLFEPLPPQPGNVSAAGLSETEFKQQLRIAVYRNFHGECRMTDDASDTGRCRAPRLIDYLAGIQGWYESQGDLSDYSDRIRDLAVDWQGRNGGGGACGRPYTWGNLPNVNIPLPEGSDTPLIGQSRVIDWVYYDTPDFDFFVIQEPSFCGGTGASTETVLARWDNCYGKGINSEFNGGSII
jgi:hypothetical protein